MTQTKCKCGASMIAREEEFEPGKTLVSNTCSTITEFSSISEVLDHDQTSKVVKASKKTKVLA